MRQMLRPGVVCTPSSSEAGSHTGWGWPMEYVLYRYKEQPTTVAAVAATADPLQAAVLAQDWVRSAPEEGLIVTIDQRAVIHHRPQPAPRGGRAG